MKQKFKRWMAGLLAVLTVITSLFTDGATAFAASASANISFWYASVKNSGEISELKVGFDNEKVLYSMLDGHSAYCMNFGLSAKGGQLMNSYENPNTSMTDTQTLYLRYCLYYGFSSTTTAEPSSDQCDQYIATQAMVWIIEKGIYGTSSADSAAKKLCDTAPNPASSFQYYTNLKVNIDAGISAVIPSFAASRISQAPTYELKWNEGNKRFETTLNDSNGVLSEFDLSLNGYGTSRDGDRLTIYSSEVNTNLTTGTFSSNSGKVEVTGSCVFWLTGNAEDQEFVSEVPHGDPLPAYINVKTEDTGYGELYKEDKASGVKLSGAVYGIYS
ncbi:MAG: thioester domain-containing protein, partial [Lachnospiraceae bacterium]|nr:thioester domain-containing protein [Lachnospiraceae bacterium]